MFLSTTVHNKFPGVSMRRATVLLVAALAVCVGVLSASASAFAAPALRLTSSTPEYVTPSSVQAFLIYADVQDVGDAPLSGNLTYKITLPEHVTAEVDTSYSRPGFLPAVCEQTGQLDECVENVEGVPVGGRVEVKLIARVEPSAEGVLPGRIEVSGGGATEPVSEPFILRAEPAGPFAIANFGIGLLGGSGVPVSQAGAAPVEQATDLSFVSEARENLGVPVANFLVYSPSESQRDVIVHVPAGFVGNPTATARCKPSLLTTPISQIPECPFDSQVGLVELFSHGAVVPLYNIEPPAGTPAEFAFMYQSIIVRLQAKLRPSDDGIDIVTADIPSTVPIYKFRVTLWGSPSDRSHDPLRGHCLQAEFGNNGENCTLQQSERSNKPFLRMPTSCTGEPLHWGVEADTYQHVGSWVKDSASTPAVEGCGNVPFAPGFSLKPSTLAPHNAGGANVTLSMSQDAGTEGVAPADVRDVSVKLPAGVSLNPSSANGLQACTDTQLGFKEEGTAQCPAASKVGSLTLKTPFLDHEIGGSIFLLSQKSFDPASGELFRIAVEVRSDQDGVDIKLPGKIMVNPVTGQITTMFENLPQLPFESITLHFEGGAHPVLVTPETCGTYTTNAVLTGWNGKTVQQNPTFTLNEGCDTRAFAPSFTAGTNTPVAGAYTPFSLQLTRTDSDQELSSLSSLTLPKGLLADIGSVPRCSDSQVAVAACPESTRLGNVTVGAGAGSTPVYIDTGNAYLTGPYKGAPFGIAFLIHAQAGPFDLGMVVVRAALNIDPHTAQATIQTDPLPTIVKGVPVRLRDIRVNIDRSHFMLNPTNCQTMAVTGTANSTQGATAPLTSRFQVGECRSLKFKPKLTVSTSGHTSRRSGASLHVRLTYPSGSLGAYASLASVKVKLPKHLPSNLPALQQACPAAQFQANPAGCPTHSVVGQAVVHTQLLSKPLVGPAYFVSHGGEAFPNLILVLQGEGVTVDVVADTLIKHGVTSSTFPAIPDVPIESFELTLPQGKYSALDANGNLCKLRKRALAMPTAFVGQNGAAIHQNTPIAVTGCARHKASKQASKARKRK